MVSGHDQHGLFVQIRTQGPLNSAAALRHVVQTAQRPWGHHQLHGMCFGVLNPVLIHGGYTIDDRFDTPDFHFYLLLTAPRVLPLNPVTLMQNKKPQTER